ncbi:hypothetical protein, partial [Paracoccus saliphilus]|uniref:hypothetical protein n=1 Tax=Paracoccus saliphilus TaxID=405559 RepID=UPI0026575D3B
MIHWSTIDSIDRQLKPMQNNRLVQVTAGVPIASGSYFFRDAQPPAPDFPRPASISQSDQRDALRMRSTTFSAASS